MSGRLFVVATPIGNLADMVPRAVSVLQEANVIAAEDTRHSLKLLQHFNIDTPLIAYHDHSSERSEQAIVDRLLVGEDVALISDAGTPLISDPGYRLVASARQQGVQVVPVPGACALVAALSVSGLATDRFVFEGFLPAKSVAREKTLLQLQEESRTMVFYEAPHRLIATLQSIAAVFGGQRKIVLARELTKQFETVADGSVDEILAFAAGDSNQCRGEIVLVVAGASRLKPVAMPEQALVLLGLLAEQMPPKKAAAVAAEVFSVDKKQAYQWLIDNK